MEYLHRMIDNQFNLLMDAFWSRPDCWTERLWKDDVGEAKSEFRN